MGLDESDTQRIEGRMWAEEAIEEAIEQGGDFLTGFSRAVKRAFPHGIPAADRHAMTDDEAKAFEEQQVGFGKHSSKTWGTADVSYIDWLAEQGRPIQEYVRSEMFKRRQDSE